MKKTITSIFLLIALHVHSQSWQLFPLDSLRCYEVFDTDLQPRLQGMDFRTYSSLNLKTTIRLDSFSHFRFLPYDWTSEYFGSKYITGNSVFGHWIVCTPELSTLYFVNNFDKSEVVDSFVFKPNKKIGSTWLCFENENILILATITGQEEALTLNGLDSIRTIQLRASRKDNPTRAYNYDIQYGKKYGVISAFDFDSLRKHSQINRFTEAIEFLPYQEYTEKSFFNIEPTTETHSNVGVGDWYNFRSIYTKQKYFEEQGAVRYDRIRILVDTDYQTNKKVITSDTSLGLLYVPLKSSNVIFNPIPNAYNADMLKIQHVCDNRTFRVWQSEVFRHSIRIAEDTIRINRQYGEEVEFYRSFIQGIGEETNYARSGPKGMRVYTQNLTYIKMPNCELGSKLGVFAGNKISIVQSIKLYPNPATSYVYIEGIDFSSTDVLITNALGQECSAEISSEYIKVLHLPSGIYQIQIKKGDSIYRAKLVIN